MTNPAIDSFYELAMSNGAVGGKLVGAGAGGPPLLRRRPGRPSLGLAARAQRRSASPSTWTVPFVLVRD